MLVYLLGSSTPSANNENTKYYLFERMGINTEENSKKLQSTAS